MANTFNLQSVIAQIPGYSAGDFGSIDSDRKGFPIMKNDTSILLSISMLISGKEDMQKSLESLLYFKNAVSTEIILVDTGCNPEQRALAEKYADKIVDFTWCNDFAAARNAGLKEAKGLWFMYLDDDEWFDNPREIISFFQSGEYKEYHCASYVVRNYRDRQGKMYDDSYPSRMVELMPDTVFVGRIHEYLEPFRLPKKTFSDFVHHYGYAYRDEEHRRQHTRRNVEPLLEMIREQPGDPRWSCQLAQEYFGDEEYEMTIKASKEGIEDWKRHAAEKITYAPSHVGALYAYILISLEMEKKYEEEKDWLKKALKETPYLEAEVMAPTRAFYYLVAARLYSYLKDYGKTREYFEKYMDYLEKYGENRNLVEAGSAAVVEGVFQEQLLYGTILMCTEAAIRMEDHALAERAFFRLDWTNDPRLLRQNQWEKGMLEGCCSVPYHPLWVKILQTLVSRREGMKEMQVVFLEVEIELKQQGELEKLFRLNRLAAELDFEHSYILAKKIVWTEKDPSTSTLAERREKAEELLGKLFEKYPEDIFDIRPEVWDAAGRMGISCEPYLLRTDYNCFRRALEAWCRQASPDVIRQWDERIGKWKTRRNMRYDLFTVKCMEGYLHHFEEVCPDLQQMEPMLWRYADAVLDLYEPFYREFVFEEVPEILPEEAQLALRLKKVQWHREQRDDLKALEAVRKCLGVCPALGDVMDVYARMYRDQVQNQSHSTDEEQVELRYIIATLKKKAKQQIEKGEYQIAREILFQIRQCAPDDEEVKELLGKLP